MPYPLHTNKMNLYPSIKRTTKKMISKILICALEKNAGPLANNLIPGARHL